MIVTEVPPAVVPELGVSEVYVGAAGVAGVGYRIITSPEAPDPPCPPPPPVLAVALPPPPLPPPPLPPIPFETPFLL